MFTALLVSGYVVGAIVLAVLLLGGLFFFKSRKKALAAPPPGYVPDAHGRLVPPGFRPPPEEKPVTERRPPPPYVPPPAVPSAPPEVRPPTPPVYTEPPPADLGTPDILYEEKYTIPMALPGGGGRVEVVNYIHVQAHGGDPGEEATSAAHLPYRLDVYRHGDAPGTTPPLRTIDAPAGALNRIRDVVMLYEWGPGESPGTGIGYGRPEIVLDYYVRHVLGPDRFGPRTQRPFTMSMRDPRPQYPGQQPPAPVVPTSPPPVADHYTAKPTNLGHPEGMPWVGRLDHIPSPPDGSTSVGAIPYEELANHLGVPAGFPPAQELAAEAARRIEEWVNTGERQRLGLQVEFSSGGWGKVGPSHYRLFWGQRPE